MTRTAPRARSGAKSSRVRRSVWCASPTALLKQKRQTWTAVQDLTSKIVGLLTG